LVVFFIDFKILTTLSNKFLKFFDSLTILHRLSGYLPHLSLQIGLFELLVDHGNTLFIEFKVGFNKLHEEQVVVVHEGSKAGLGVKSGTIRVALVSYFLA